MFRRLGDDLLSRALRQSTIGAKTFHYRVREGIGCFILAIATKSSKHIKLYRPNGSVILSLCVIEITISNKTERRFKSIE